MQTCVIQHKEDLRTEERFCRFRLCDDAMVQGAGFKALWEDQTPKPDQAVADFRLILQRDPNFPFNWANLGDALAAADHEQEAAHCFREAVELAPRWPPVLMRAVNFYFQSGNAKAAFPLAAQILHQVKEYDATIFEQYVGQSVRFEDVLQYGLPQNPRPARAFLSYLARAAKPLEAKQVWRWEIEHGFADLEGANAYVGLLLAQSRPEEAMIAWRDYQGPHAGDYGTLNYAFNGGFESDWTSNPLDWQIEPTKGVEVTRDSSSFDQGKWSLRVRFDGKQNLTDIGVELKFVLKHGRYRLRARVRTEGLTTDQGIRFRISSAQPGLLTASSSRQWVGTNGWSTDEIPFTAPVSGIYAIRIGRTPSLKFDNLIAGTLWIDNVRVESNPN